MRYVISILLISMALGAVVVGVAGFRGGFSRKPPVEIFPDMNRQLKLRPQKPNDFFRNGVSSQLPPPGTIARIEPMQTLDGPVYPFETVPANTGHETGATNFIPTNPLPVTGPLLQRGRERFDIFCAPCHGKLGDGNGITKVIGALPAVVSLHDKRIVAMPDGEIFNTITHGKNTMGAYGSLIPVHDRWAIVAYLRALELSRLGSPEDLPPDEQAQLGNQK